MKTLALRQPCRYVFMYSAAITRYVDQPIIPPLIWQSSNLRETFSPNAGILLNEIDNPRGIHPEVCFISCAFAVRPVAQPNIRHHCGILLSDAGDSHMTSLNSCYQRSNRPRRRTRSQCADSEREGFAHGDIGRTRRSRSKEEDNHPAQRQAARRQSITRAIHACRSGSRRSAYGDQPRLRSAIDTYAASALSGTMKPALRRPFGVSTITRRRRCGIKLTIANGRVSRREGPPARDKPSDAIPAPGAGDYPDM